MYISMSYNLSVVTWNMHDLGLNCTFSTERERGQRSLHSGPTCQWWGSVGSPKNFSVYLQRCFHSTFLSNASICFYLFSDLPDDLKEQWVQYFNWHVWNNPWPHLVVHMLTCFQVFVFTSAKASEYSRCSRSICSWSILAQFEKASVTSFFKAVVVALRHTRFAL